MTKISKKTKKIFLITLFSILLVACLLVADCLSYMLIKTDDPSEEVSSNEFDLYMLSLNKSQVEKEAKTLANDFYKTGAGGYIWKNEGYYHVITSAYLNKNDAVLVQNDLKIKGDQSSEIFAVHFPSITLSGSFSGDEKKVLKQSLSIAQTFYTAIYDISLSVDTNVNGELESKLLVNSCINNINTIYSNFDTLFPSPCPKPLEGLQKLLYDVVCIGQDLLADERPYIDMTYSSHLKYRYLQVFDLYYKFVTEE